MLSPDPARWDTDTAAPGAFVWLSRDSRFADAPASFVATLGGLAMLKGLAGPLHDMRFCPTGGISESNAAEFLSQPNVLCIGGSWMLDKAWLAAGDYARVRETTARAAQIVRDVRAN